MTLYPSSPLFSLLLLLLAAQGLLLFPAVSQAVGAATLPGIILTILHVVALFIVLGVLRHNKQLEVKLLAGWHFSRILTEIWVIRSTTLSWPMSSVAFGVMLLLAAVASLILFALLRLLLHRHGGPKLLLDSFVVVLVVATAAWSLGISELILSLSQVPLLQIGTLTYVGICLLLGVMAVMLLMQSQLGRAGMALTVGVAFNIAGDILFGLREAGLDVISHDVSPLLYSFAAASLSIAAWRLYQIEPPLTLRGRIRRLPSPRFDFQFLPYIAALFACFLLVTSLPQSDLRERGILWGTALLIAFVMLRQWLSQLEENELRRRLEASRAEIEYHAYHDALTGLANRAALEKLFVEDAALLGGQPYAIFSMDLDGFKAINDTHGHQVGDLMLQHTAKQLQYAVTTPGRIFRWGGDEFVVVFPGLRREADARALADAIRVQIAVPVLHNGQELRVGASVGYTLGRGANNYEILLSLADSGMYRHKQKRGRSDNMLAPQTLP